MRWFRRIGRTLVVLIAFGLAAWEPLLAARMAPPPALVILVPAGPCRVTVNGWSLTMDKFRTASRAWAASQREIHFQADPSANYDCVDRALRIMRENGITKFGFVGNEMIVPENSQ